MAMTSTATISILFLDFFYATHVKCDMMTKYTQIECLILLILVM